MVKFTKVILTHLTKNQSIQEIFIPLEIEFEIELFSINKTKQNVTNINWLKYEKTYNKNITCDFFSLLRKECLPSFKIMKAFMIHIKKNNCSRICSS